MDPGPDTRDRGHPSLGGRPGRLLGGRRWCLGCALHQPRVLVRWALKALLATVILVVISHGTSLAAAGSPSPALLWQLPMTYAVSLLLIAWIEAFDAEGRARRGPTHGPLSRRSATWLRPHHWRLFR